MKFALLAGLIGVALCADNDIQGPGNVVVSGKDNHINGKINTVDGWRNVVKGDFNDIDGDENQVKGNQNLIDGNGNLVIGTGNIVMGAGNVVDDRLNVQIDMSWAKNLKTQFDPNDLQNDQFIQGMTKKMYTNPSMTAGQFQQDFAEKIKKQMQLRLNYPGAVGHPALQRMRHISQGSNQM